MIITITNCGRCSFCGEQGVCCEYENVKICRGCFGTLKKLCKEVEKRFAVVTLDHIFRAREVKD